MEDGELKVKEGLKRLLGDRVWRLEHLYWVTDEEGRMVRFVMREEQRELLDHLWYRNDVLKARQLGISTFTAVLILDLLLFNSNFRAGVIDRGIDEAKDKLDKVKFAYDMLDYVPEGASREERAIAELGGALKAARRMVKRNDQYVVFSNRSMVKVGITMRGRTLQFLHVSELGYVSAHFPKRAREIKTGAMNSVSPMCCIIKESTHEGGKSGVNYDFTRAAMECVGRRLNRSEFRFFFFPWWRSPKYELEGEIPRLDSYLEGYFEGLEAEGVVLSDAKKSWYASQWRQYGFDMFQEYPSTPEEALNVPMEGAIYGMQVSALRAKGRVGGDFEHEGTAPLFTAWDIGLDDSTAIWLFQRVGQSLLVLDHYQANDFPTDHYVRKVREWAAEFGSVSAHLLPHDAAARDRTTARSYADVLREAQIGDIRVVKRTPDVWLGINDVRMLLPNCVFHRRCSERVQVGGVEFPSGVECLENYHKRGNGAIDHDVYSHSADAFRMIAEARAQGLIEGVAAVLTRRRSKVVTGAGAIRRRL